MITMFLAAALAGPPLADDGAADALRMAVEMIEAGDAIGAERLVRAWIGPEVVNDQVTASLLFGEAIDHAGHLRIDAARVRMLEILQRHPQTRAAATARHVVPELDVVGRDAGELEPEMWFQGKTSFEGGRATLLVFWELWCPHCRTELPALQALQDAWGAKGLQVVGITQQTQGVTKAEVRSFLRQNAVSFPIGRDRSPAFAERFGVGGVPSAAVVRDGKVVWRGHPAVIDELWVEAWLAD